MILEWFSMHEFVSEYAENILACTKNTLKAHKRLRRKRQEYFVVGEYFNRNKNGPISTNFRPKPKKNQILIHLPRHDQMGKKTSHATVPLNTIYPIPNITMFSFRNVQR